MKTPPKNKTNNLTEQPVQARTPIEAGVATIVYKPWKYDIFIHADWCHRWFVKLIDMKRMNAHGNCLVASDGKKYVFRRAVFYNFRQVLSDRVLDVCENLESGTVWILRPDWMTSLTPITQRPVHHYEEILEYSKLFKGEGETMRRLINNGTIKEILK